MVTNQECEWDRNEKGTNLKQLTVIHTWGTWNVQEGAITIRAENMKKKKIQQSKPRYKRFSNNCTAVKVVYNWCWRAFHKFHVFLEHLYISLPSSLQTILRTDWVVCMVCNHESHIYISNKFQFYWLKISLVSYTAFFQGDAKESQGIYSKIFKLPKFKFRISMKFLVHLNS